MNAQMLNGMVVTDKEILKTLSTQLEVQESEH
jgi:hypothetical protein